MHSMENIIAFILGGGRGSRIYPLTRERSKPAIPFGGKYRIIDIPISNCMNSRIYRIFVLTQYNSKSLNQHINRAYRFDHFNNCFVDVLPAEQTLNSDSWYQGTADAIRQNLKYLDSFPECDTVAILSGDQIYNMDLRKMYQMHVQTNADATIAATIVPRSKVKGFGIMKIDPQVDGGRVIDFIEKPIDPIVIDQYRLNRTDEGIKPAGQDEEYLASMGIYFFKRQVLANILTANQLHDFGKELIPHLIQTHYVATHIFKGYWEDIGTIRSFHQANLDLLGKTPKFSINPATPIYTNPRFLPPSFCINSTLENATVSDGARIYGGVFKNSIIGVRSHIEEGCTFENVLMLGADWTETPEERIANQNKGGIPLGVGKNCVIKDALIDKNACIGNNVQLINVKNIIDYEDANELYFIKEGIIVIPKGSVIPDYTVI